MIEKLSSATTAFVPSQCRRATRPRACQSISKNGNILDKHVSFMSIDDTLPLDPSSYVEATTSLATSLSGITPVQNFEPVLNTQAATSFIIIAIVFTLLQLRINAVSNAAKRRSSALEALRKAESLQLSGASDVGIDAYMDGPSSEEQVLRAKDLYETALKEELDLRTIIPGVRIVAPNDPKRDEEERAAAKRFLGWGSDEFGDDDPEEYYNNPGLDESRKNIQMNKSSDAGLSNGAKAILFGVASMLIVLLWTLSFDPMVADQIFTNLGGSPPSNMPPTSW